MQLLLNTRRRMPRFLFSVFALLIWLQTGSVLEAQVYFHQRTIDSNFAVYFVKAFDFDRDGDFDILSGHNDLAWWKNDGYGNFSKQHVGNQVSALWSIYPVDLDRDGDYDLLIADSGNHDIVWYKNNGGSFHRIVIESGFTNAESVAATDFDGDGDIDIVGLTVGTSTESGIVVWWRNNGSNSFSRRDIDLNFARGHKLDVADINNDGYMDVVAIGAANNGLVWWRGGGNGSFTKRIISSSGGLGMAVVDMDGNGSLDVVSCNHGTGRVALHYNNGSGSFSGGTIASGLDWPSFPAVDDLNKDGRLDVVVFNRDDHSVAWLENTGGSFTTRSVEGNVYQPFVGDVADLNGDGIPDIVSGSKLDKDLYIWETTGPTVPKTIRVVQPNGGESYTTSTTTEIEWSTNGDVGSVEIEFSSDGGSTWQTVVSSTSNDGRFTWQPPHIDSDDCLIRIREAGSGDPSDVSDNRFSLNVPTYSLSGNVVYAGGLGPIRSVDVSASGDLTDSQLTGVSGLFEMDGIRFGSDLSLTTTKNKEEDQSAATITSFDAAMAARAALGLETITSMQEKAADVDRNGQILLYDAAIIARYAVGLAPLPDTYVAEWAFDPGIRNVNGVNGDMTSLDFTGVVLGDVSLSWNGGISKSTAGLGLSAFARHAFLDDGRVELGFRLPRSQNILSFDISLSYATGSYDFVSAELVPKNSALNLLINDREPGVLKIGGYATTVLAEDVDLSLIFSSLIQAPGDIVVNRFAINDGILITSVPLVDSGSTPGGHPTRFTLKPNYPNPFNSETVVGYEIDEPGVIQAAIYDVQGRQVYKYQANHQRSGAYSFVWPGMDNDGNRVSGGVYFLQFSVNHRPRSSLKITYIP